MKSAKHSVSAPWVALCINTQKTLIFQVAAQPTYSVSLVELVEVEVPVLPPRAAAVGQDAAAGHHHGSRLL